MHNASFDIRFTKNFYGVDLLPALHADTALLVHTVKEEGAFGFGNPFGLKSCQRACASLATDPTKNSSGIDQRIHESNLGAKLNTLGIQPNNHA
jgi:hypothetical protein